MHDKITKQLLELVKDLPRAPQEGEFVDLDGAFRRLLELGEKEKYELRYQGAQLVIRWLEIKIKEGKEYPPLSYSYPNYKLLENNESSAFEVWELEESFGVGFPCLVVDQAFWKIEKKISDREWLVRYRTGYSTRTASSDYKWSSSDYKWSNTVWRIWSDGFKGDEYTGSSKYYWRIKLEDSGLNVDS